MPAPINNSSVNMNRAFLQSTQHVQQGALLPTRLTRPGEGLAIAGGMQVQLKPVSSAGFTSAYATPFANEISRRARVPLSASQARTLLANKDYLRDQAEALAASIKTTTLNDLPHSKQIIHAQTKEYIESLPISIKSELSEAIDRYQEAYGDNFFMNLACMGFKSLPEFLQHLPPSEGSQSTDLDEFVEEFGHHYGAFTGMVSEEEEMEALRMRLEDTLQEPSLILKDVLHHSPAIDGVPLLKGATSGDNPVTTRVQGDELLNSVLSGESIHFNSFLSTTSSYHVAMQFCGRMASSGMGEAQYTVDLTKNDAENEILRRQLKKDLESGNVDSGSILLYMKSNNALGISINAAKVALGHAQDRMDSEDEILLSPGHSLHPEQVIKCEDGLIVIGDLKR